MLRDNLFFFNFFTGHYDDCNCFFLFIHLQVIMRFARLYRDLIQHPKEIQLNCSCSFVVISFPLKYLHVKRIITSFKMLNSWKAL